MAGYMTGNRPVTTDARGERDTLAAFLDLYRVTLELKCWGLTAEQLSTQSVPPSNLSLLGLVRHMAEVEAWWFRVWNGEEFHARYDDDDPLNGDFDFAPQDQTQVDETFAYWRGECEHAREVVAAHDLDEERVAGAKRLSLSLRWVLVHMIEEYARHCGHADFLRERIDGATGY